MIPSLPGFGFSPAPTEAGWNTRRVAVAFAELMARLGYRGTARRAAISAPLSRPISAGSTPTTSSAYT